MRTFAEIAAEMEKLASSGDIEMAHGVADDLLLETIDTMNRTRHPDVDRIIVAFRELEKWYA